MVLLLVALLVTGCSPAGPSIPAVSGTVGPGGATTAPSSPTSSASTTVAAVEVPSTPPTTGVVAAPPSPAELCEALPLAAVGAVASSMQPQGGRVDAATGIPVCSYARGNGKGVVDDIVSLLVLTTADAPPDQFLARVWRTFSSRGPNKTAAQEYRLEPRLGPGGMCYVLFGDHTTPSSPATVAGCWWAQSGHVVHLTLSRYAVRAATLSQAEHLSLGAHARWPA